MTTSPAPSEFPPTHRLRLCGNPLTVVLLLGMVLIMTGCSQVRDPALDRPEIAVVRIGLAVAPTGESHPPSTKPAITGRGFYVSSDGLIVTCRHLLAGRSHVPVILSDGRSLVGQVVQEDASTDLAMVKVQVMNVPFLRLFPEDVTPGLHVRVVGRNGITLGTFNEWDDYGRQMALTAPVGPLDAGSPVLADEGSVVGVVLGPSADERTGRRATPAWCVLRMMPLLRLNATGQ